MRIFVILLFFMFSCAIISQNDSRKYQNIEKILEYQALTANLPHVGMDYINAQPKVDFSPFFDSLTQYSSIIDNYIDNNSQSPRKLTSILRLLLHNRDQQQIIFLKVDRIFDYLKDLDAEEDTYLYMINFLAILGNYQIKHNRSLKYCFDQLEVGKENYRGKKHKSQFYAYIFYIKKMYNNDKKEMKKLKKILEQKEYYNDEFIKKRYDEIFGK